MGVRGNLRSQWDPTGLSHSSRLALAWQGLVENIPYPEAHFIVEIPKVRTPRYADITVDLILRYSALPSRGTPLRIPLDNIYMLFRTMLETFAFTLPAAFVNALPAVDVGPIAGPNVGLHSRDDCPLDAVLETNDLGLLPGAKPGLGAELLINTPSAPINEEETIRQARDWLRELLLDNHFLNVDNVVDGIVARCEPPKAT